jgi:segregation and condensation protein A
MPDDGAGGDAALSPVRPTGDALWDDWDTPPRVPSAPVLHLDGFDGPIDLLLDLAERQRLDLGRISLGDLVDQFVAASARLAAHVPIERRADWLVMATWLVLLRSRLLVPATPEAGEEAERDAEREVARLDELRFMRAAASWLQARPQLGHDVFALAPPGPDPLVASYMALLEACLTVLRRRDAVPAEAPVYRPALGELFRIPEALIRMRESRRCASRGRWRPFCRRSRRKSGASRSSSAPPWRRPSWRRWDCVGGRSSGSIGRRISGRSRSRRVWTTLSGPQRDHPTVLYALHKGRMLATRAGDSWRRSIGDRGCLTPSTRCCASPCSPPKALGSQAPSRAADRDGAAQGVTTGWIGAGGYWHGSFLAFAI